MRRRRRFEDEFDGAVSAFLGGGGELNANDFSEVRDAMEEAWERYEDELDREEREAERQEEARRRAEENKEEQENA